VDGVESVQRECGRRLVGTDQIRVDAVCEQRPNVWADAGRFLLRTVCVSVHSVAVVAVVQLLCGLWHWHCDADSDGCYRASWREHVGVRTADTSRKLQRAALLCKLRAVILVRVERMQQQQ
jgi:hypothetical protein